jgi:single-strand DNA-binding protein
MGNLNKVMLIGRLTRDPEVTEFKNGGKVANLGFAVNNRRKNAQTGEWEEAPVWVNMKAYNHEHGRKLADLAAKLHKGRQVYVEGHLVLEQWDGKEDGKHHSKMLVYVDGIEFLGGGKPEELPEEPAAPEPEPKPAKTGRKK